MKTKLLLLALLSLGLSYGCSSDQMDRDNKSSDVQREEALNAPSPSEELNSNDVDMEESSEGQKTYDEMMEDESIKDQQMEDSTIEGNQDTQEIEEDEDAMDS